MLPTFKNHKEVKCFRCGKPLGRVSYVKEPDGAYYKECKRCSEAGVLTYYFIKGGE